eukprot:CAMPEP_0175133070 /NCGR_PEP_ID=MMETSP0087-20121206/7435_1 /TAXON_ID=136419 /ORGANISM="Unknown Unknown, Strain D1" /LENGTH=1151 /DNA_ID=CAMNT_0016415513 /DNA_START=140 /DNA_END=3595 /DNA_ORIENTATION=+
MPEDAAVQVAVRVRPFNGREKAMNAKRCIDMEDKNTYVYEEDAEDTDSDPRTFAFDFSLWSHFDFVNEKAGENPDAPNRLNVDQDLAYEIIGKVLLGHYWDGYDVCMFAYGQSGAGKSFSMTGTGPKCAAMWKGIIPRICNDTFVKADELTTELETFKITASMLEIYVGKIYDLLIPPEEYNIKTRKELSMQLDSVNGLSDLPVKSEGDVTDLLVRGFGNQTKAPTGLNVDSSRGHTIFTLKVQRTISNPKARKKSEKSQTITTNMKLVDLAGSERTEKVLEITKEGLADLLTQKYGKPMTVSDKMMEAYKAERTVEGRSINNSLTSLGNCVKQVAKLSEIADLKKRKAKMDQIAWRASALTRLLRTALNGKCKTIMIAAVSPSLTEYPETVSTMRYANQIKQIKSTAVKQEAKLTTDQLQAIKIKELEEKLAAALSGGGGGGGDGGGGGGGGGGANTAEMEALRKEMEEMKRREAEALRKEKEMEARMEKLREEQKKREEIKAAGPHLLEILNNPMTSGLVPTALPRDQRITAGPSDSTEKTYECGLRGTGVKNDHCVFNNQSDKVTLIPNSAVGAQVMVNGSVLEKPTLLKHNDRVRIAENNYFRFIDPAVLKTIPLEERQADDTKYDYEFMQKEAMSSLVAAFQMDAEMEEKKKQEFEAQMAQKEAEYKSRQAELDRLQQEQVAQQAKLMEDLENQMKTATEAKQAELAQALASQQEEFNKMVSDQKLEAEKQAEEIKLERKRLKKMEEDRAQKAESDKSRIQYDLMEAIPAARTANQHARELGCDVQYDVKLISDQTALGLENNVVIMVKNSHGLTEMWKIEKFRTMFGIMTQQYHDNEANIKAGKPATLPSDTPFKVKDNVLSVIGHAKPVLKFLSFCLPVEDTFHIISYTGVVCGSINVQLSIDWNKNQLAQVDEIESLRELTDLKTLDLVVEISSCQSLPKDFASDVRCEFVLPDFVVNTLLPEDGSELKMGSEEDMEDMMKRGGSYMSPFKPEEEGQLTINPNINYKRTVRIFDVGEKVLRWFEDGELVITVSGETPDCFKAGGAGMSESSSGGGGGGGGGSVGGGGNVQVTQLERMLAQERAARVRAENERNQAMSNAGKAMKPTAGSEAQQIQMLQKEIAALKKKNEALQEGAGSKACTVL